jgi:hypothetical protein
MIEKLFDPSISATYAHDMVEFYTTIDLSKF